MSVMKSLSLSYFVFIVIVLISSVYCEICVDNVLDIYEGYNSSLYAGAMVAYGEGLLLLGRDATGYHVFSYVEGRDPALKKHIPLSGKKNSVSFANPFLITFDANEKRALFEVMDEDFKNYMVYYISGDDYDVKTFGGEDFFYMTNMVQWEDHLYSMNTTSVLRLDLENREVEVVTVEGCDYPHGMKNLNDEYLLLTCLDSEVTNYYTTVVSHFSFNGTTFVKQDFGDITSSPKINRGEMDYILYDHYMYFSGRNVETNVSGVYKTNFSNGTTLVIENGAAFLMGGELYFSTRNLIPTPEGKNFIISALDLNSNSGFTRLFDSHTSILQHFMLNDQLYLVADCISRNKNPYLCHYNELMGGFEPVSEEHYFIQDMFGYNNHLFFSASSDTSGSELYMVNSTGQVELVADIWRGERSGKPSTFIHVGARTYLIAANIYVGRELFSITERPDCSNEDVILCTDTNDCDQGDGNTTVIYVGDVLTENTEFTSITVIEGSLIGTGNINLGLDTTVLGSISLAESSVLTVNSSTKLSVRDCISTQNSTLVINLTPEEFNSGSVSVLDGVCINGDFNVSLLYGDPCSAINIDQENYGKGLSVSFEVTSTCFDTTLVIGLIAVISIVILAGVLIILLVPPIHAAVFPHRKKSREHQKSLNTKRDSDSRGKSVPKSRKGTSPA